MGQGTLRGIALHGTARHPPWRPISRQPRDLPPTPTARLPVICLTCAPQDISADDCGGEAIMDLTEPWFRRMFARKKPRPTYWQPFDEPYNQNGPAKYRIRSAKEGAAAGSLYEVAEEMLAKESLLAGEWPRDAALLSPLRCSSCSSFRCLLGPACSSTFASFSHCDLRSHPHPCPSHSPPLPLPSPHRHSRVRRGTRGGQVLDADAPTSH